ncbi:MAG: hypothetical protein AMJ81_06065, partial [Phycisphaerae bacterium SM23_33]
MPRDWQAVVDGLSNVQKLVHLAMRHDPFEEERIRGALLKARRRAYEDELTIQAQRVGCNSRAGHLRNGPILSELAEMCARDATSIVNTYNYDLAAAIVNIRSEVPTANRHVYAKRLQVWEAKRAGWKDQQIALYTENSARALAQQHFFQYNGHGGSAQLQPKEAVCPVCRGWVARGETPLNVAQNNPPPYHVNCPHFWETKADRWNKEDC